MSTQHNALYLTCYYNTYHKRLRAAYDCSLDDNKYSVNVQVEKALVAVGEITFDSNQGKVFYHDGERQKETVEKEVKEANHLENIRMIKMAQLSRGESESRHKPSGHHLPNTYKAVIRKGLTIHQYEQLKRLGLYDDLRCNECQYTEEFTIICQHIYCLNCKIQLPLSLN